LRREALSTYFDLRALKHGDAVALSAELEQRSLDLTAFFESRMAFFLALVLQKRFKRLIWKPIYHIVPVDEFDVKVMIIGEIPHVFITDGAIKFFEFVAHSTTFEDMVTHLAQNSEAMRRTIFGPLLLNPPTVLGPTKIRILREAFNRESFSSVEEFAE